MGSALKIKQWDVTQTPNEEGNYVVVVGRTAGLVGWTLDLMGVSTITTFTVGKDYVILEEGSFAGNTYVAVPMNRLSGVVSGYTKPIKEAVIMGIVLAVPTCGLSVIGAVIYYIISKQLTVGVLVDGAEHSVAYTEATVDGVNVGREAAAEVTDLIRARMDAARK
jgi:hypothetical protein